MNSLYIETTVLFYSKAKHLHEMFTFKVMTYFTPAFIFSLNALHFRRKNWIHFKISIPDKHTLTIVQKQTKITLAYEYSNTVG